MPQAALLPCPTWKAPLRDWQPRLPWHPAHPTSTQARPLLSLHVPTAARHSCCVPTRPRAPGHSNQHLPVCWGEPVPSEEHPTRAHRHALGVPSMTSSTPTPAEGLPDPPVPCTHLRILRLTAFSVPSSSKLRSNSWKQPWSCSSWATWPEGTGPWLQSCLSRATTTSLHKAPSSRTPSSICGSNGTSVPAGTGTLSPAWAPPGAAAAPQGALPCPWHPGGSSRYLLPPGPAALPGD